MRLRSTRGPAVLGVALLTALLIAACGGSSSSSSSSTSSSAAPAANSSAGATGGAGAFSARFSALAACLKKAGVTVPSFSGRRFGATGGSGFAGRFGASGRFGATGRFGPTGRFGATAGRGFLGGGGALRGLLGNSKYAAALRKCGGFGGGLGAGPPGARAGFDPASSQDRTEVSSFIACMKAKGVKLPPPNFSGSGSVFGTAVNTSSAAFTSAYAKCKTDLKFLASGGPPAGGGAPGA
jgi:hypothetical protein